MRAMPTPSVDDRPRFHSNVPVSELIERDTRVVEASVVSSAPLVAETEDGVMHETWQTPTEPHRAWGLEPPDPRSRDQGSRATSRQTDLGEKMQMSPSGLCLSHLEADKAILTFLFDPSL